MQLTYQALLDDPSLIEKAFAAARRERANAVHELIVQPIQRFFHETPETACTTTSACG